MQVDRLAMLVADHCSPCFRIAAGDIELDPSIRKEAWELVLIVIRSQFMFFIKNLCEVPELKRDVKGLGREFLAYPKNQILLKIAQRPKADLLTTFVMSAYALLEGLTNSKAKQQIEGYRREFYKKLGGKTISKAIDQFEVVHLELIQTTELSFLAAFPPKTRQLLESEVRYALTFSLNILKLTFQQYYDMLKDVPDQQLVLDTVVLLLEAGDMTLDQLRYDFESILKDSIPKC